MSALRECTSDDEVKTLLHTITQNGNTKLAWYNQRIYNMAEYRLRGWVPREEMRFFHQSTASPSYIFGVSCSPGHSVLIVVRTPPEGDSEERLRESIPQLMSALVPTIGSSAITIFCLKAISDLAISLTNAYFGGRYEVAFNPISNQYFYNEKQSEDSKTRILLPLSPELYMDKIDARKDAAQLHAASPRGKFESVNAMELRLARFPNVAIRKRSDGELVAWILGHEAGHFAQSYTLPEYRKMRLSEIYSNALGAIYAKADLAVISGIVHKRMNDKYKSIILDNNIMSVALDDKGDEILFAGPVLTLRKDRAHL